MGYHRAGFEVVGVDIKPQPRYPFEFHQADAMTFPLDGFDAIHASPPCQAYVQRNKNLATKHPKLIEPTRCRLVKSGAPYVIENVIPEVLITPWMACGTAFGLALRRHRYFEMPTLLSLSRSCYHWGTVAGGDFAAVYGRGGKGHRHGAGVRDAGPKPAKVTWAEAMGIDWMERKELSQAIPPAYTEYIGRQLLQVVTA
jgi:DNA (cytosine-5)-methyltransferase 1